MSEDGSNVRLAVILTAISVEYQAVRAHLIEIQEVMDSLGAIYERGKFSCKNGAWNVAIAQVGAGNANTAVEVERAINHFAPVLILFVGVAGGLKDVKIGDVVAATRVHFYASGKTKGKARAKFEARPDVNTSTDRLVYRAQAEAHKPDWLQRIKGPIPNSEPRVFVAPIASGDQVIASTEAEIYRLLQSHCGDAVAVEMEGHGFLKATRAHRDVDALVIRGISDLIDGKSEADANNSQDLAARHASAFAFEILAKLDSAEPLLAVSQPDPITDPEARLEENVEGPKKLLPTEPETPVVPSTPDRLKDFRNTFSQYCEEIRTAFAPFDTEQDIHPDECGHVIDVLNNLYVHVQELSEDGVRLDLAVRWDLNNILEDIRRLKKKLPGFRDLCPHRASLMEQQRRYTRYKNDYHKICAGRDSLFDKLAQLKLRLRKATEVED